MNIESLPALGTLKREAILLDGSNLQSPAFVSVCGMAALPGSKSCVPTALERERERERQRLLSAKFQVPFPEVCHSSSVDVWVP